MTAMTFEDRRAGWRDMPLWVRILFWQVWLVDRVIWGHDSWLAKTGLLIGAVAWTTAVTLAIALPFLLLLLGWPHA